MVHGFMGGSTQWNLQRTALSDGRDFITVDLPGFSIHSDMEGPNRIAGFAEYVWSELDKQGVADIHLLGHSMGGMIVQEMVALQPDRVKKLVLYGTASTGNLPGRFESFETSKQRTKADGVSATARRISATWFLDYENAKEFENCASLAERSSLQAMLAALDAMKTWSRTDNLPKIACETLIVWGEKDRTYRWPQIEQLWNTIPNSSLAVMPACSHAAHMEKPELFNAIVSDFLNA